MQLVGAGSLENPDKPLGRLVDYLGNFKDLLSASHGPSHQMTSATALSSRQQPGSLGATMPVDPGIRFPGESDDYREARNRLLKAETELRAGIERVAEQRRSLPLGGPVPEDYRFEGVLEGGREVPFSQLFEPGKDTLVIYSFMFPRRADDTRPGAVVGETAQLPLAEQPCPSCTSILDSLDGAARHLARRVNLAVVAKTAPERLRAFADERGWRHLRLLSSRNNGYNRAYNAETPEGEQNPMINVFIRAGDDFRHTWASELFYAPSDQGLDPRHVDQIWPPWNVLDLTPGGRGGPDEDLSQLSD